MNKERVNDEVLTRALRSLPKRTAPADVSGRLRVLASREQRRATGTGIGFLDRARLFSKNLMRPLALPLAGGVFSTIVLFSLLYPAYPVHASNGFDIPIPLTSRRSLAPSLTSDPTVLKTAPMAAYGADDVIVDVMVDGQGRMIDYTIVSSDVSTADASKNDGLRRSIGAVLLLTEFHPATTLGLPVAGKVRLSVSACHSSIDVKG